METRTRVRTSTGIIYLIICIPTGKVYVGQTRQTLRERWQGHLDYSRRPGSNTYLACAIRKYGSSAFKIEILEECPIEALNDKEIFYIAKHRSNDRRLGFNMSLGGDGGQNSISPEVRLKISKTRSGQKLGPCKAETKQKISAANKGKVRTAEQRQRIRESRDYSPLSEEHRAAISAGLRKSAKFKLNSQQREEIFSKLDHYSDSQLAAEYNVSRKMIWRMRKSK